MYVIGILAKRIVDVNLIVSEQWIIIKTKNLEWYENVLNVALRLKLIKRRTQKI